MEIDEIIEFFSTYRKRLERLSIIEARERNDEITDNILQCLYMKMVL